MTDGFLLLRTRTPEVKRAAGAQGELSASLGQRPPGRVDHGCYLLERGSCKEGCVRSYVHKRGFLRQKGDLTATTKHALPNDAPLVKHERNALGLTPGSDMLERRIGLF